jgi:hypothetical protein
MAGPPGEAVHGVFDIVGAAGQLSADAADMGAPASVGASPGAGLGSPQHDDGREVFTEDGFGGFGGVDHPHDDWSEPGPSATKIPCLVADVLLVGLRFPFGWCHDGGALVAGVVPVLGLVRGIAASDPLPFGAAAGSKVAAVQASPVCPWLAPP